MPHKTRTPLRLDSFLCFSVYALNNAFGRLYKGLLDGLGLTYPQYLVMVTLWEDDGLSVGEIGERLSLESSTLTPLLKRLEAQGLVERRRSEADERRVLVKLTKKGRRLAEQAAAVPAAVGRSCGLAPRELEEIRRSIDVLRGHIAEATP
ncbi:MAG: MarR family transcriptional regulator [Alsobacter sp.]